MANEGEWRKIRRETKEHTKRIWEAYKSIYLKGY